MRAIINYSFLSLFVILISSCGSVKFGELGEPKEERTAEKYGLDDSLTDVLRRHGGINVTGYGSEASVTIRGNSNSIKGDVRPLFVLNGVVLGHGIQRANNLVIPSEIHRIIIKKSLSETAIYGESGKNGVIEIRTKANKDSDQSKNEKRKVD